MYNIIIMAIYLFFCFLMGLACGSFANVGIHRLPKDLSVLKPRSFCPNCRNLIKWYDNIPVFSYLFLKAKCRNCGLKIPIMYPSVELVTGILFLLLGWKFMSEPGYVFVYCTFTLFLVMIAVIDYIHQIIPDILSLCILILGVSFSFFNHELGMDWKMRFLNSISGGLISAAGLFLVGYIATKIMKKDAMGGGDVKLILAIGTIVGLKKVLIIIFLASILGTIVGMIWILTGKNKKDEYIPFGPFINIAAYISLFLPVNLGFW